MKISNITTIKLALRLGKTPLDITERSWIRGCLKMGKTSRCDRIHKHQGGYKTGENIDNHYNYLRGRRNGDPCCCLHHLPHSLKHAYINIFISHRQGFIQIAFNKFFISYITSSQAIHLSQQQSPISFNKIS